MEKIKVYRLSLGKWLIDKKTEKNVSSLKSIRKILFIHYDGKIGDYIVSTFVYSQLREQNPQLQIDTIVSKSNIDFIKSDTNIDSIFLLKGRSYFEFIRQSLFLRKQNYDVLFDATPSLRNRDLLFIRLVNASFNIGYNKENYKIFNSSVPKEAIPTAKIYQQMMLKLGYYSDNTSYIIPKNDRLELETINFLNSIPYKKIIVVNLFGASRSRKFSKETALVLLNLVLEQFPNHTIVLLTYPQINSLIKEIIDTLQTKNVTSFLETTSIFHTIAIIKRASLVITPDTVVVHISDAYRIPLVAFYSMDEVNFSHWNSIQEQKVIVRYQNNINQLTSTQISNALQNACNLFNI